MDTVRRLSFIPALLLLVVALVLGRFDARSDLSADASARLASATAHFDSLIAHPRPGPASDTDAISVGYLERLRLGLGSPFRLVDEALHDRRLSYSTQRTVAWALLGGMRRGDDYTIDPVVLDGAGPDRGDGSAPRGADHVALIERAIATATDPRAAELSVRLAYLIAAADGSVGSGVPLIASRVAALVRDRALASVDLHDLLRDARRTRADVLDELHRRRAARAFAVEGPPLAPLSSASQVDAMEHVGELVRAIDSLRAADGARPAGHLPHSLLDAAAAARLAQLGAARPPSAPVAVTMRIHRELGSADETDGGARLYERFVTRSVNDETLAATYAPIAGAPDSLRRASANAILSAAVALRTLAQSEPWFPGDPGPTVADLSEEFGLRDVTFERGVPAAWRPYYLGQLEAALHDQQSVLPGFFPNGLSVAFRMGPLPDSALAMHEPRSRTLQLSIWTSEGTLAHELSHDLDWQAARQLFAGGTGYSTDRAMREQRGALASSMRGLTEARLIRPFAPADPRRSTMRPAELFAQSTDWLVASALARQGRVNGFLSAVQDPLITGYAAGAPTAIGSVGAQALVSALEQMTYLPDSVRDGFLAQWADPATVDPVLLVRRVLETPVSWRAAWYRPTRVAMPTLAVRSGNSLACLVGGESPGARARTRLVELAVDARARGVALRRARFRFAGQPAWAKGLLGVPPWSPVEGYRVVADLRAALVAELASSPADQGLLFEVPPAFRAGRC